MTTLSDLAHLPLALRMARERAGLKTREEAAARAGVTEPTIERCEGFFKKGYPSVDTLFHLLVGYEISLRDLEVLLQEARDEKRLRDIEGRISRLERKDKA